MKSAKLFCLLVILLATATFLINRRHHVSLLGGADEGSYIAWGKILSQELSFVYEDESATVGKKYLPARHFIPHGFKVYDEASSPVKVVSGWNKGFSLLTIPFWWIDNDAGWQYLTPLAGALSLLVLFIIGSVLRGPFTGFAAALLLASNFLHIWFSRYPMTEVVSQLFILLMALCLVLFVTTFRFFSLLGFSVAASIALLVHFGNAPIWLLLATFICGCSLPLRRAAGPQSVPFGIRAWSFEFAPDRVRVFLSAAFLSGFVPAIVGVSYWFLDPGIQRYTRLGKKMAKSTGQVGSLIEAFSIRLENLSVFLPLPTWGLLVLGLWLILREQSIKRRLWLLLVGLAVCSFLVIVSTGVGNPRLLYVARRNVPVVLPILFLVSAFALDNLRDLLTWRKFGAIAAPVTLVVLSYLQVAAFAPFAEVNQGRGAPEMARRVRAELQANRGDKSTFVIIHRASAIYNSGLRYVYGVPILVLSDAVTPEVVKKMLDDGIQLYALDIEPWDVAVLKHNPQVQLNRITSQRLGLSHPNPLGPTVEPTVSDRLSRDVVLYRVVSTEHDK